MNEKKIRPEAAPMPATPNGANGSRLSRLKPVKPTTANMARMPIFTITMTTLARADSLVPRTSSRAHSPTSTTAGRLIPNPSPPPGACDSTSGMRSPTVRSSRSLRYCDHSTDTAAVDTPYSRIRQAPTSIATNSPMIV